MAPEPPHGATIVVYRHVRDAVEFLILHRAHSGREEGHWAWTPPSGARYPDETIVDCAHRELGEETGLELDLIPIDSRESGWRWFAARLEGETEIRLSDEHDRHEWVTYEEAIQACRPRMVSAAIMEAARALDPV